ncbi:MAG: alkaline phosphatase family protein [Pseudomonadota bacterium]
MTKGRTIVIGMESAELTLVEQWVREGVLPFLGSLLSSTPLVTLRTPNHVLQVATWPSLFTGASAGRHGQYVLWSQIRTGSYAMVGQRTKRRGSLRRYEEFLADHGIGCAVADIPADMRVPNFRGIQIVDWGTEFRLGTFKTQPQSLADRIRREVGLYPLSMSSQSGDSQGEHLELAESLKEGARLKGTLTRWLMQQPGLDHIFCTFSEMHKGAHWFWKYMDRNHVDHEESSPALREALRHIYEVVDRELAMIAAQLGPHDNLIVMSEQGMQANYRGDHLAEPFLEALGLLVRNRPPFLKDGVLPRGGGSRARPRSAAQRALAAAKALLPDAMQVKLERVLSNRREIDWPRTRVFVLPTDRNTYLRVNLQGREPLGCVQPGAEYEALLDRLEMELRALRNGSTGRPAVVEVFRMREIFPGDRADDLPDLAVEWAAESPIDALRSTSVGTLSLSVRELRSGNHRSEGFLLARGPAFVTGAERLEGDILQIAPTLLLLHGVPLPSQFERGPLSILKDAAAVAA